MGSGITAVDGGRPGARFGGDVRSLLKRHQVPCGGETDLRRLSEFLFTNAAFRSDLFALCSSISHMAEEDLTADELLGLVTESYGPGLDVPEEVRAEFSAAYQGWNARELALELPERSTGEVKAAEMPPAAAMAEVDETLQRLSVSSLELKMFLADVKQRVSEIDPELEHLEQMVSQMKAGGRGSEAVAVIEAKAAPVYESATVRRLRFAVVGLAAALVIAVWCGAWLARGYWESKTASVRIVDGDGVQAGGKGDAGGVKAGAQPPASRIPAAVLSTRARMTTARAVAAMKTAAASAPAATLSDHAAGHTPAPIVRVDPDAKARASVAEPVFVPSSTMIGYALATPKPLYPAVSVPDEKEGRVEVRATISPEGEVVATHVLSGPVIFREAADKAMRNWRFRPYLVDGTPVQVSTTVAFVFRSMPAT